MWDSWTTLLGTHASSQKRPARLWRCEWSIIFELVSKWKWASSCPSHPDHPNRPDCTSSCCSIALPIVAPPHVLALIDVIQLSSSSESRANDQDNNMSCTKEACSLCCIWWFSLTWHRGVGRKRGHDTRHTRFASSRFHAKLFYTSFNGPVDLAISLLLSVILWSADIVTVYQEGKCEEAIQEKLRALVAFSIFEIIPPLLGEKPTVCKYVFEIIYKPRSISSSKRFGDF